MLVSILISLALLISGCTSSDEAADKAKKQEIYKRGLVTTAKQAEELLVEGNERFTSKEVLNDDISESNLAKLTQGQNPFAAVLSCSDSRVPPEILFDQGLGDLFVVRTAGNVADAIALGSLEYAVEHLKTPLLVVMGHSKCGAVKASVDGGNFPGNISAIVAKIKPSVDQAKAEGGTGDGLYSKTEDINVETVMANLLKSSPVIKELVEEGKLKIVGAKYHVDNGKVTWIEPKEETESGTETETRDRDRDRDRDNRIKNICNN